MRCERILLDAGRETEHTKVCSDRQRVFNGAGYLLMIARSSARVRSRFFGPGRIRGDSGTGLWLPRRRFLDLALELRKLAGPTRARSVALRATCLKKMPSSVCR